MPDVSPPWWNLGHTTWFFAKNVLEPHGLYRPEDARLEYVLNSYYEILGPRVDRTERGLQTRPTTDEIYAFRERTDERLERLLADGERRPVGRDRVPGRHRHPARAAAPGAVRHRDQAHPGLERARAARGLPGAADRGQPPRRAAASTSRDAKLGSAQPTRRQRRRRPRQRRPATDRARRRARPVRQPRGRLVLRQRARRAQGVARPVRGGRSTGDQPRLPRVHERRRLPRSAALAGQRLGRGARSRHRRRRSTGSASDGEWMQWTLAGHASGRARRAGLPRELLRGGRLRALAGSRASRVGGLSASHRARVGARGAVAGVPDEDGELPRERTLHPQAGATNGRPVAAATAPGRRPRAKSGSGPRATTRPTLATSRSTAR